MYTISLCIYADSQMIWPPRTPALGHEFFNKKLIRSSRRMDAIAAKSDAVTAWKCTITDAYRRWFPVRGFCSFRVWPCQSVPQCDWAFNLITSCVIIFFLYFLSNRITLIVGYLTAIIILNALLRPNYYIICRLFLLEFWADRLEIWADEEDFWICTKPLPDVCLRPKNNRLALWNDPNCYH